MCVCERESVTQRERIGSSSVKVSHRESELALAVSRCQQQPASANLFVLVACQETSPFFFCGCITV